MNSKEKTYELIFTIITFVGILGSLGSVIIGLYLVISFAVFTNKPSQTSILAAILSVMLFIAISNLDRYRTLRRIDTQSEKTRELIEQRILKQIRAAAFFDENAVPNSSFFSTATQIDIVGITLGNTTKSFVNDLSRRLEAGARIRFILISKEEDVLEQVVRRSFGQPPPEAQYYRDRINAALTLIRIIAGTQNASGTLEIGLLPYVPSFGSIVVDPDTANGKALIEIYHHNSQKPSPKFSLSEDNDPQWFFFFKEQFDLMWEQCEIQSPL